MKCDPSYVTCDTGHMTGGEKSQNFSSLPLLVWEWKCFKAPATQGLSNNLSYFSLSHNLFCNSNILFFIVMSKYWMEICTQINYDWFPNNGLTPFIISCSKNPIFKKQYWLLKFQSSSFKIDLNQKHTYFELFWDKLLHCIQTSKKSEIIIADSKLWIKDKDSKTLTRKLLKWNGGYTSFQTFLHLWVDNWEVLIHRL